MVVDGLQQGAPSSAQSGELPTSGGALHDTVYRELRQRLMTGKIMPDVVFSTRGLAQTLGVSQTPIRAALGRLATEGALQIRSKRGVEIPEMTASRFEDLVRCRLLLEPEAARGALPFIDPARLAGLKAIDRRLDVALANGDVAGYMETNHAFHFAIYQANASGTLNQLIEMLWLQFGPYMRLLYGRVGTAALIDHHQLAIAAIEARDGDALARAVSEDIAEGMGVLGRAALANTGSRPSRSPAQAAGPR